jgi:hypothetical protein
MMTRIADVPIACSPSGILLEGTTLAAPGEDVRVRGAQCPDLWLRYAGETSSVTEQALISYWYTGMIYLGFSGEVSGGRRYSMIVFVQPARRGRWQIHYQVLTPVG